MFRRFWRSGSFVIPLALCASVSASRYCDAQTAGAAGAPNERTAIPIDAASFGEGWSQSIPLEADSEAGYKLWVKEGWLQVRRHNDRGDLDWQIALARISGARPPTVFNDDGFELSYRDGRYFIRETRNVLRSVREPADAKACSPRAALLGEQAKPSGRGRSRRPDLTLSIWEKEGWFVAATGPDDQCLSAVVRLVPAKESGRNSEQSWGGGLVRCVKGQTWFLDDGELLATTRMPEGEYKWLLAMQRMEKNFPDSFPAKIDASGWLNTQEALSWDTLKGKVVLLDFWAARADSAKMQKRVQQIADKYRDRGLVVVGIHSAQDAERCKAFVEKQGLTFPVAIDSGKTAERFAIDEWPSLFLIDESGKIVSGYRDNLPTDAEIEELFVSERVRKNFPDLVAPKIDASRWLNTADALPWEKLKGKVVLLDFWGVWCGPCVSKLPDVQTFADKYRDRGVVVIGIHSARDGEKCRDFVAKRGITFPIAIDSGKTAESFAVEDWPALFLIDKTGKVVRGYCDELPNTEEMDKLLRK
jgi:peroxiredoxin